MANAVVQACNGGLRAKLPAGSRGRSPGQEVREAKPSEAEALLAFGRSMEASNLLTFLKFGNAKNPIFVLSLQKNHEWLRNWGAWSETRGACAFRPGPKTATAASKINVTLLVLADTRG